MPAKKQWVTKNCDYCRKEVTRPPSQFPGKNIFCSPVCNGMFHAKFRENNPSWRNGKYQETDKKYILLYNPKHHRARKNGYVLEHIIVMENILGRQLTKNERVHHINHNPADNRPENLKLYSSNGQHLKEENHHKLKHAPCPCGKPHKGHGLCTRHLRQLRETGKSWDFENNYMQTPEPGEKISHRYASLKICPCGQKTHARGLCNAHYQYFRKYGKLPEFNK